MAKLLRASSDGSAARRPPRALIAGAAGFIGSHLVDRLLIEGYEVIGMDDLITGRPCNLAHLQGHPRFSFVEHDIARPFTVDGPLDWVMHLASPASPPKYQQWPVQTLEANSFGTHHLLDLTRAKEATFLLASTSEVYGDPLHHPQQEEDWGNVNPNGPRSMYDEGKRYAEAATMTYHRHYGLPVRIVRIFNTYGPRMDLHDGRIVTNFIRQALSGEPLTIFGDGSQTRSLQYVSDLLDGIVRYMACDDCGPMNLGNPVERSVSSIAQMILHLTGSASPIVYRDLPQNDPRRRRPDISRARALLGWQPRIDAEEGLALTIAAAREAMMLPPEPFEAAVTPRVAQGA
ncbi:SDR family oxidoreductase [Luteibacter sp. PPL201]|uniref:UDP-glucuronate decarboxylase n=1 Tax=Luteibacter sahnii TaxID=3021977 RepID=A0ABT6BCQ2_9GAMM|nr:UDP-glucuronic acid decarboxylase family protein [Luteibacter sp. PPL193]MDY1549332.1 SDR family oxidoreductase [Luteibacter sp. PPL193]